MENTQTNPATGAHTDNGTPHGYTSITPFLVVADPVAALTFYQDVFGARLVNSTAFGDVVVHAELEFADGRLQLGAASPEYGTVANDPGADEVQFSLAFYCPDVDAVAQRAVDAGATLREPVADFVSGDRFAGIRDPFGIRWSVMTRVEDLSDAESDRRIKEWAAQQG